MLPEGLVLMLMCPQKRPQSLLPLKKVDRYLKTNKKQPPDQNKQETKNFCTPVSYRHWQVGKTRDVSLHLAGYPGEVCAM